MKVAHHEPDKIRLRHFTNGSMRDFTCIAKDGELIADADDFIQAMKDPDFVPKEPARPSGVVLKYARPAERMWNAPHMRACRPSSTSAFKGVPVMRLNW